MRSFLAPVALFLSAASYGQSLPNWGEFKSAEGRFSVQFPAKPTKVVQPIISALGTLQMTIYLSVGGTECVYGAGYVDFPAGKLNGLSADALLENARNAFVRDQNRKLIGEQTIQLNGVPGRELRFQADGNKYGVIRCYLQDSRMFATLSVWGRTKPLSAELTQFFESFKIR